MKRTGWSAGIAAVAAMLAGTAHAGVVNFVAYTNNSTTSHAIATSAILTATATSFTIELKNASTNGSITDFYLETGAALSSLTSPVITNGPGTSFSSPAVPTSPTNVHNAAGGAWSGNFFTMDSDSPIPANGVNPGEWVRVSFTHDGTFSLAALEAAMASHDTRLVIHYQSWGGDYSEWLSSSMTVIPLPPAAWAGMATLAGLLAVRRAHRRRPTT